MNARESTEGQIVFLDRGDYTTCNILLRGCTVLSWRINNEEQLFVSRVCPLSNYSDIRGGIKITWPHHSTWAFGSHNGFGRDLLWSVIRGPEFLPNGDVFVDVGVSSDYYTKAMWHYDFELIYRITLHLKQLTLNIIVKNTSKYFNFDFNLLLQAYIKIQNLSEVRIDGLQDDCSCTDLTSLEDTCQETSEENQIHGLYKQAYYDTPDIIDVFTANNKLIKMTKQNLPDVKVWNPGEESFKKIKNLDEDEYKDFVAIETGFVNNKQPLETLTDFKISLNFKAIKLDEEKVQYKHFYDYFEGYC